MLVPPVGNVDPAGEQHLSFAERVFDELAQRIDATGLADEAWVQTNRHHLRMRFALTPQFIEATLEIVEEIPGPTVSRQQAELAVVVGEGIGDNEVRFAKYLHVVRKV